MQMCGVDEAGVQLREGSAVRRRAMFGARLVRILQAIVFSVLLAVGSTVSASVPDDVQLPPVEQFREGDRYQARVIESDGQKRNSFRQVVKRNGAWTKTPPYTLGCAENPDSRCFEEVEERFFPSEPRKNEFFASKDGLLHRYVDGHWTDLPMGSKLKDLRGTLYQVDVRVTPYDVEQLNQIFAFRKLTQQMSTDSAPENVLLPMKNDLRPAADPVPKTAATVSPPSFRPSWVFIITFLFVGVLFAYLLDRVARHLFAKLR